MIMSLRPERVLLGLLFSAAPLAYAAPPATPAAAPGADVRPVEELNLESLLNLPVVTASGKTEEKALAAASVVSITREEIARHNWRSLSEVLSQVPGLYVVDDGVIPSVGVRGVTGGLRAGTRILRVMINGVQVNFRPDLTAFIGPEYIPMEAVERIEIAKGPLSALYGANAFLATVNVITRTPEQGVHWEVGARGYLPSGIGSYGGSGVVSVGSEHVKLLASASTDQIDRSGVALSQTFPGQQVVMARNGLLSLFGQKTRGDLTQPVSAFAQLEISPEKAGTLTIEGGMQRMDSRGEYQLASVLTHQTRWLLDNFWISAAYRYDFSDQFSLAANVSYGGGAPRDGTELYLTNRSDVSFRPNFGYHALSERLEVTYSPSDLISLRLGLDGDYDVEKVLYYTETFNAPLGNRQIGDTIDLINAGDPRQQTLSDAGLYLQATSTPFTSLRDLHLIANVRVDMLRDGPVEFPLQLSWRAAVAYRWSPQVTTKLIAGRAFQTPSGVLMFAHTGFGNANNVLGNQTFSGQTPLRPQAVTSVELATSAQLLKILGVEASVYWQQLDDKIEFVQLGSDFSAANQGQTHAAGLELESHLSLPRVQPYLIGTVLGHAGANSLDFSPLPSFPSVQGIIGADLDLSEIHLRLNAQARVVGPRGATQSNVFINNAENYNLPGYTDLSATLSTTGLKLIGDGETRFSLSVTNLLGQNYSEPGFGGFDVPERGRRAMLEVRQLF